MEQFKYYSGAAWVNGHLKRYDGSAWVDAYLWRYNGSAWVRVACTPIPTGLIIPINTTSLPSGWSWYNPYDGYWVRGAGGTTPVNTSGGTWSVNAIATGTDNDHHGGDAYFWDSGGAGTESGARTDGIAGAHYHTGAYFAAIPNRQYLRFIKAGSGLWTLPRYTWALTKGNTAPAGCASASYTSGDGLFVASSKARSAQSIWDEHTDHAGEHDHRSSVTGRAAGGWYNQNDYDTNGLHDHDGGWTVNSLTWNMYQAHLRAWEASADEIALSPNLIGMYESITPPTGWYLCNGANGTPDLRDRFIFLNSDGTVSNSGDGKLYWNLTTGVSIDHSHISAIPYGPYNIAVLNHAAITGSHTHNLVYSGAFVPPYHCLAFIMKA